MQQIIQILFIALLFSGHSLAGQVTAMQLDRIASHILYENGITMQGQIVVNAGRASGYASTVGGTWNSVIYVDPWKMQTLSANTWAFIIGHELAHVYLGHTQNYQDDVQNEFAADRWGAWWAANAGYDVNDYLQYMATEPDICTPSHGCWYDRIRNIMNMFGANYYQSCGNR